MKTCDFTTLGGWAVGFRGGFLAGGVALWNYTVELANFFGSIALEARTIRCGSLDMHLKQTLVFNDLIEVHHITGTFHFLRDFNLPVRIIHVYNTTDVTGQLDSTTNERNNARSTKFCN
jgi:hypothetical protein